MGKAKRRKLLAPNFGTKPKFTSGMGFSNHKKEEFTARLSALMSPDAFAENLPVLSRQQEIQKFLVKSSFLVMTVGEVRASEFLMLTFIERTGSVVSVLISYKKLGKVKKSQLQKMVVEINQYYAFELEKAKGNVDKFIDRLEELSEAQLPL